MYRRGIRGRRLGRAVGQTDGEPHGLGRGHVSQVFGFSFLADRCQGKGNLLNPERATLSENLHPLMAQDIGGLLLGGLPVPLGAAAELEEG
ncbi:MAG TPA: hypothetical protein VFD71_05455 [Planctomycetota bacterium]|nr:hypothetical protein [Planctomycetota bacterium]